jgi:hypothetical protein
VAYGIPKMDIIDPNYPCFVARLGGVLGGKEIQG